MDEKSTLVVFTFNPPDGHSSEGAFLHVELEYLIAKFNRVIVVPQVPASDGGPINAHEADFGLANMLLAGRSGIYTYLAAITSVIFWREVIKHLGSFSIESIRASLWFHGNGYQISRWFSVFCRERKIDLNSTVFYTYWLDQVAYGLALAKRNHSSMKLVSRAHGIDLYEHRQPLHFFPFRGFTLQQLDTLFLISRDGFDYIVKRYPLWRQKYKLSKLGVRAPQKSTKPSPAGRMQIVSCAFVRAVKRMDLMAQGIGAFALAHPELEIEWQHFGGGDPFEARLPPNATIKLRGNVPNQMVKDHYQTSCVDVFLNTSLSEGIPVSIMEAQASGIPIVAPAVGGIPEIVNSQNGILLDPNPVPDQISDALSEFIPFSDAIAQKKAASRATWLEHYDADKNYDQFSADLAGLLEKS
jgi:glycosyltransferase involved in cell wall biosynthesis